MDRFEEVLQVSHGQMAAKLQAVKFGGLRKILPLGVLHATRGLPEFDTWNMKSSLNLTDHNFAAL